MKMHITTASDTFPSSIDTQSPFDRQGRVCGKALKGVHIEGPGDIHQKCAILNQRRRS